MENDFVPPEVLAQYTQNSSSSDDTPDEHEPASNLSDDSAAFADPFGNSSSNSSDPMAGMGDLSGLSGGDPVGQTAGDQNANTGTGEVLTFKQQLQMLSPMGILRALTGDITGELSQEEQQRQQQNTARQNQINQSNKQSAQMSEQQRAMEKQQIQEQVGAMKGQAQRAKGGHGSVLFSQTTGGDISELTLTEQALRDAQKEAAKHQSGMAIPQGHAAQGPASMADVGKQKSGQQKLSEMSMGE